MKKFSRLIYFLLMAFMIFSLSGCNLDHRSNKDDSSSSNGNSTNPTTSGSMMIISSPVFEKNATYTVHRGQNLKFGGTHAHAQYFIASVDLTGKQTVTMNLEVTQNSKDNYPFAVCNANNQVVFASNPSGTGNVRDNLGTITIASGTESLQKYTGLALSTVYNSSIGLDDDEDVIEIVLSSSDNTAKVTAADGTETTLGAQEYIWHVSPDVGEYWTLGSNSTQLEEDEVWEAITSADGVYIARDIRYMPNNLGFSESQTSPKATDDTENMYVVYYSTAHSNVSSADTYILAALPGSMGMGGDAGGTPPDGNSTTQPGNGGTPPDGGNGTAPGGTPPNANASNVAPSESITSFSAILSAMTHSASDAYNNPVLHITRPGAYKISGTWKGQIWVDIPDESVTEGKDTDEDDNAHVILILNGVTVNCSVAPALVFKNVYEYAGNGDNSYDTESGVAAASMDVGPDLADEDNDGVINAGATVLLVGGTTNTFTGTNLARINKLKVNTSDGYSETADSLKYVKSLKKMYKLDGAFHSRMSMVIADDGSKTGDPGKLIINADYEGLDSEEHMYIDSGVITVTADDDGINVNDDNVSVFHMAGGSLTVTSTGGDGIDSNGYIIFTGADALSVTASSNNTKPSSTSGLNAQAEGPLDADKAVYMTDAVFAIYTVGSSSSGNTGNTGDSGSTGGNQQQTTTPQNTTETDGNGNTVTTETNGNTTTKTTKDSSGNTVSTETTTTTTDSSGKTTTTTTVKDSTGNTTETTETTTENGTTTSKTTASYGATATTESNSSGSTTATIATSSGTTAATVTLNASASEVVKSSLSVSERISQGVATSGTNFKLVEDNNDFYGLESNN
ncbi:MAG: carbohydrate-binding domain-containing protein [Synergistaceae bacterium]|nr:carbohydrate-binding domain-containing protein [Synergistaceae bacterium]